MKRPEPAPLAGALRINGATYASSEEELQALLLAMAGLPWPLADYREWIHRQADDGHKNMQVVQRRLDQALRLLLSNAPHDSDDTHLSVLLDWLVLARTYTDRSAAWHPFAVAGRKSKEGGRRVAEERKKATSIRDEKILVKFETLTGQGVIKGDAKRRLSDDQGIGVRAVEQAIRRARRARKANSKG